jgi:oxaloacetate decarboxylase alpha subunit
MNLKEIKEIISLMNENKLAEIEVEREGVKLKIKKSSSGVPGGIVVPGVLSQVEPAQANAEETSKTAEPASPKTKAVASPMVGTFYRAPSPEAPPFVEMGQVVEVGQVVCIVEAMKLMNEIKSDVRGKVVGIPVENAEPVEFSQTLFEIEPV